MQKMSEGLSKGPEGIARTTGIQKERGSAGRTPKLIQPVRAHLRRKRTSQLTLGAASGSATGA